MKTIGPIIIFLFAWPASSSGQSYYRDLLIRKLSDSRTDTARIRTMLELSAYYIYKPLEIKEDLDSAEAYLKKSRALLQSVHSPQLQYMRKLLFSELAFEKNDCISAIRDALDLVETCRMQQDKHWQARAACSLAYRSKKCEMSNTQRIGYFDQAIAVYAELKDTAQCLELMGNVKDLRDTENALTAAREQTSAIGKWTGRADTSLIRIMLDLGANYLYRAGNERSDMDSAASYINKAVALMKALPSVPLQLRAQYLISELLGESTGARSAQNAYMTLAREARSVNDKEWEAMAWYRYALKAELSDYSYAERIGNFRQAFALYQRLKNYQRQSDIYQRIVRLQSDAGIDSAEQVALQWLQMTEKMDRSHMIDAYEALAEISDVQGRYEKELRYGLEMINSLPFSNDSLQLTYSQYYVKLSRIYQHLEKYDQCLSWLYRALNEKRADKVYIRMLSAYVLTRAGKFDEAITLLTEDPDFFNSLSNFYRKFYCWIMADCYSGLKDPSVAERYYGDMLVYFNRDSERPDARELMEVYLPVSRFYIRFERFREGEAYLRKVSALNKGVIPIRAQSEMHLLMYRVDSANGRYLAAIGHYKEYKRLADSVFNSEKSRQIEELQIKYEIAQKDKVLALKEQNIQLLTKESNFQKIQLHSAKATRSLFFAAVILMLLLLGVAYNRFKVKQRLASALQQSQMEIYNSNLVLQELVNEKDDLLAEKEWLLKEVHHRVKNNLQIVSSLLNIQSAHLQNDYALNVIRQSQNRLHTMSLIHGKLYQTENISKISMPAFIEELVGYLDRGMNDEKNIRFELSVDPIELDAYLAVPIGLLLNEIVTNCIKHAFAQAENGLISISMRQVGLSRFAIDIADNGIGFPEGFVPEEKRSLGISLIKVLTRQLGGVLTIGNDRGAHIHIEFDEEVSVRAGMPRLAGSERDIYE